MKPQQNTAANLVVRIETVNKEIDHLERVVDDLWCKDRRFDAQRCEFDLKMARSERAMCLARLGDLKYCRYDN